MKYRDLVNTKIQRIENDLKVLGSIVRTQQPIKSYIETLARTEEHLEELKGLVSIEPVTNNEVAD
tara:strand:+ start:417 stop:611 length:195 start_codon:yes stop_codon:yes gene_type:complete